MSQLITLSSNVNYPKNTIASFTTILNQRFNFDGNWVVGISEISYVKSWYNIQKAHEIALVDEHFTRYDVRKKIPEGYYDSANELIDYINIKVLEEKLPPNEYNPKLEYNPISRKIKIMPGVRIKTVINDNAGRVDRAFPVYPEFDEYIENILGLKNRNIDSTKYFVSNSEEIDIKTNIYRKYVMKGHHPVELNAGHYSLYVYSNIVAHTPIGDTCAQLLRIVEVPSNKNFGDSVVIKYDNPQYRPLFINEFNSIEIKICDDSGDLIPFKSGRVTITLHFKKL